LKTKVIAEAKIKTDTLDARTLAHLLRSDLVAECYIAPREIREDRSILRLRTNLVQDRTRVMNRVRSLLDKYDVICDYDNIFGVKGRRWLKSLKLSDNDQILLHEYLMQIEFLNAEIKNIESKITCEASKNESVKILMSMTGIDYFSAMMIASEIGDITRFSTPEELVSWSGFCPSIHQSGNSLYMGRTKYGNKKVRWFQAANTAARKDLRITGYTSTSCFIYSLEEHCRQRDGQLGIFHTGRKGSTNPGCDGHMSKIARLQLLLLLRPSRRILYLLAYDMTFPPRGMTVLSNRSIDDCV
jgi:transposase